MANSIFNVRFGFTAEIRLWTVAKSNINFLFHIMGFPPIIGILFDKVHKVLPEEYLKSCCGYFLGAKD